MSSSDHLLCMASSVIQSHSARLAWSLLIYIFILLLSLRLLLPVLLAVFIPALSISSVRPFSIGHISWRSPSKSGPRSQWRKAKGDCINVTVGRIGLRCGWGGRTDKRAAGCARGTGWIILRVQQVKIVVPRAWIVTPAPHREPPSSPPLHPPASPSRLASLARSCLPLLTLFAIEISFELVIEQALLLEGTISGGTRITKAGKENRFAGWMALDGVRVLEVPPAPTQHDVTEAKHQSPSPPRPPLWPALHITERFSVVASAPLRPLLLASDSEIEGLARASIKVSVAFEEGSEGVHVRVHELKRIVAAVYDIAREARKRAEAAGLAPKTPSQTDLDEDETRGELSAQAQVTSGEEKNDATVSPLVYLRCVELSLPLFLISAHYNTPTHIVAASPSTPLPKSVAFAFTVKAVRGKLWLGGTSDDKDVKKEHKDWIGKERALAVGASFEWGEIEGRVKSDASEGLFLIPFLLLRSNIVTYFLMLFVSIHRGNLAGF